MYLHYLKMMHYNNVYVFMNEKEIDIMLNRIIFIFINNK